MNERVRAGEGVLDDGFDRKTLVAPDHNLGDKIK